MQSKVLLLWSLECDVFPQMLKTPTKVIWCGLPKDDMFSVFPTHMREKKMKKHKERKRERKDALGLKMVS